MMAANHPKGEFMNDTNDSAGLLSRTLYMVNHAHRDITFAKMAREIGVDPAWITRFRNGDIDDPSVNRVQKLHDFLASKEA